MMVDMTNWVRPDPDAAFRRAVPAGGAPARDWLRRLDAWWVHGSPRAVRFAVRGTAALLLPVECVCCRRPDAVVCGRCARALRTACLRPRRVEHRAEALPLNPGNEPMPVIAAGSYEHELAAVVLAYKNHQMPGLAGMLVPPLARAVKSALDTLAAPGAPVVLVPVPTRLQARNRRGYFPVGLLLGRLRRAGVLPEGVRVARLVRYRAARQFTAAQKGKGRRARGAVRNSMCARRTRTLDRLAGRGARVLLIDDVLTTGSTLAEAQRALAEAGLPACGAVVLAATPAPDEKRDVRSTR